MNKIVRCIIMAAAMVMFCAACGKGDPYKKGIAAGKAACECYRLDGFESVEQCISKIENENREYLDDTTYLRAMESEMLKCLADDVADMPKAIRTKTPKAKKADTVASASVAQKATNLTTNK